MDQIRGVPIALFGPVSYYQSLLKSPFQLEVEEVFVKQTFRSRYEILGPNGKLVLSVPVKKVNGSKTKTVDIEIDDSQDWRSHHLRSIRTAYAAAPYFEHYFYDLKQLYSVQYDKLIDLSLASFNIVKEWYDLAIAPALTKKVQVAYDSVYLEKKEHNSPPTSPYYQVFFDRFDFVPDLSIIDLAMNEGPMGRKYLFWSLFSSFEKKIQWKNC